MTDSTEGAFERTAWRITAIYLAVGLLWIVVSERLAGLLAAAFAGSPGLAGRLAELSGWQTARGVAFVALTGIMLHLLIVRGMRRAREADERVRRERAAESARYQDLVTQTHDEAARTRETRQRLEEQLRQSQKMEAVGLLAGGVAHDFNNLLVAISGYAELAAAHVPRDSPAQDEIDGIRQAVERGAGLARQLLALSRRQVQQPVPLDLNAVVADLGRMLPRVLGGRVELSLRTEAQPSTIMADLSQVEQLVLNLCVNARDAMPDGGRLLLQTETLRAPAADGAPGSRRVALVVTDTGSGMDAATRERMFEPFFSTKPAGQGTGLGLSTVYAIVQQSGASIACSSAPGRGTTFRIEFPLVAADEGSDGSLPDAVAHGTETVILALDDTCARETSERALLRHGYSVLAAGDLPEAEALAGRHAGPVHVLVTGAALTGGRGAAALARLRERHAGLGVLLVTGRDPLPPSAAMPGVTLLAVPFTPLELASSVRRALVLAAAAAPGGRGNARAVAAGPPARGLTVLVADDDTQVCRVVREMLESAGHAVLVAANGAEALQILRGTTVDVVLCDMLMPEKEGIETCTEMHRRHPGLPFIAMSGAPGGSNYMRIAVKLGAVGSLAKPFSRQDLVLALDRALAVREGG